MWEILVSAGGATCLVAAVFVAGRFGLSLFKMFVGAVFGSFLLLVIGLVYAVATDTANAVSAVRHAPKEEREAPASEP